MDGKSSSHQTHRPTVAEYLAHKGYIGMPFYDDSREHLHIVRKADEFLWLTTTCYDLQTGQRSMNRKYKLREILDLPTASSEEVQRAKEGNLAPKVVGDNHKKLGNLEHCPTRSSHRKPHH